MTRSKYMTANAAPSRRARAGRRPTARPATAPTPDIARVPVPRPTTEAHTTEAHSAAPRMHWVLVEGADGRQRPEARWL